MYNGVSIWFGNFFRFVFVCFVSFAPHIDTHTHKDIEAKRSFNFVFHISLSDAYIVCVRVCQSQGLWVVMTTMWNHSPQLAFTLFYKYGRAFIILYSVVNHAILQRADDCKLRLIVTESKTIHKKSDDAGRTDVAFYSYCAHTHIYV